MSEIKYCGRKPYCPECKKEFEPDDYYEGDADGTEWECPHCGKMFILSWEYEPYFFTSSAPCLNGEEHKYACIHGAPAEYFVDKLRQMNKKTRLNHYYHYYGTIIYILNVSDFGIDYIRDDDVDVHPDQYRMEVEAFDQRLKQGIIKELETWEKASYLLQYGIY